LPQDGRFSIKVRKKTIDLRVSTLPSIYGEKVVMRLLAQSGGQIPQVEKSGMRGSAFKTYVDSLDITSGIILITGPTGSGKTQTLAGSLARINKEGVNIITLEDPVEIRIPGINQVQINNDAGLTFASGLKSILRQDPDIIMVGEIRDADTANLAVQAALTGHLVLSTLHTNSASGALPRLLDMEIEPYLIASTVNLVVAQRLPRRICKDCIEAYIAEPSIAKDIRKSLSNLSGFDIIKYSRESAIPEGKAVVEQMLADEVDDGEQLVLYRGKGCDECDGTGYKGRVGIFEVLKVTEKIGTLVMQNKASSSLEEEAMRNGMITMRQDGLLKAIEGITTFDEVLRVSKT